MGPSWTEATNANPGQPPVTRGYTDSWTPYHKMNTKVVHRLLDTRTHTVNTRVVHRLLDTRTHTVHTRANTVHSKAHRMHTRVR